MDERRRDPDVTEQVEAFIDPLPQYPAQPTKAIVEAVEVLIERGPTLGRPLVGEVALEPDYRQYVPLFGRHLKELRPLGTDIRILFTFSPDRTPVLLVAGDKQGQWRRWYRTAIREAAQLYERYLKETGQAP